MGAHGNALGRSVGTKELWMPAFWWLGCLGNPATPEGTPARLSQAGSKTLNRSETASPHSQPIHTHQQHTTQQQAQNARNLLRNLLSNRQTCCENCCLIVKRPDCSISGAFTGSPVGECAQTKARRGTFNSSISGRSSFKQPGCQQFQSSAGLTVD